MRTRLRMRMLWWNMVFRKWLDHFQLHSKIRQAKQTKTTRKFLSGITSCNTQREMQRVWRIGQWLLPSIWARSPCNPICRPDTRERKVQLSPKCAVTNYVVSFSNTAVSGFRNARLRRIHTQINYILHLFNALKRPKDSVMIDQNWI